MAQLTEQDFLDVKDEIKDGRLSPDSIRFYLGVFMFFSALMVGIAFAVAASSSSVIGWENLSVFWQSVFWLQAILFIFQIVLIFLVRGKSNWEQILLNISFVLYTYKMALDPFVLLMMFAKNDGVYEKLYPLALGLAIIGFIIHFYFLRRAFRGLKANRDKHNERKSASSLYMSIPIIFLLVSVTGYIIKNDLLGSNDNLFFLIVAFILLVALLLGAIDFVKGAYCVIRFPSFRVNPPSTKNENV
ncbi:hypothetical protein SPD48_04525 [Pseudogracilibacillus sp. SE30717A]|uniref:hypothetical protein n=1 Tax=Pseudogracilibacillus sp. SE30717A TaxID=3098293 RepID=UPI00300E1D8A